MLTIVATGLQIVFAIRVGIATFKSVNNTIKKRKDAKKIEEPSAIKE